MISFCFTMAKEIFYKMTEMSPDSVQKTKKLKREALSVLQCENFSTIEHVKIVNETTEAIRIYKGLLGKHVCVMKSNTFYYF